MIKGSTGLDWSYGYDDRTSHTSCDGSRPPDMVLRMKNSVLLSRLRHLPHSRSRKGIWNLDQICEAATTWIRI